MADNNQSFQVDYSWLYDITSVTTVNSLKVNLSKETILETLNAESIIINGTHYLVPYDQLVEILRLKEFGVKRIQLTEIKNK